MPIRKVLEGVPGRGTDNDYQKDPRSARCGLGLKYITSFNDLRGTVDLNEGTRTSASYCGLFDCTALWEQDLLKRCSRFGSLRRKELLEQDLLKTLQLKSVLPG